MCGYHPTDNSPSIPNSAPYLASVNHGSLTDQFIQSRQPVQSPSTAAALERQNKLHEQFDRAAIQWEI